jgi:PAS domain-containing protein
MGGAVPHVELSLIEDPSRLTPDRSASGLVDTGRAAPRMVPRARGSRVSRTVTGSLERWASVVVDATEASLVLDADSLIVAASAACAEMIGIDDPADAQGRRLQDAGLHLVDFTGSLEALDRVEATKIPPLLAISSGRLARGLMRVACPMSGTTCTMDAIATPLWDGDTVVGSLTFFSRI